MSWDSIDKASKKTTIAESGEDVSYNHLVYRVFETDDGKKLLARLTKDYLNTPVCLPSQMPSFGYFREGQNDILRKLINAINRHKKASNKIRSIA